jgi:hypothetical protein
MLPITPLGAAQLLMLMLLGVTSTSLWH